jgi:hypothetical protein
MDKKKVFMVIGVLAIIGLGYYGYKIYQTTSNSTEKNSRRTKVKRTRVTDLTTEEEI